MIVMAMYNSDGSAVSHHHSGSPEIQFLQYFTVTFHGQYLKQPFTSEKVILILSGVVLNKKVVCGGLSPQSLRFPLFLKLHFSSL